MIQVYRKTNGVEAPTIKISDKNASYISEIMGADEVRASIVVDAALNIREGDYIKYNGINYTLNRDAEYTKKSDVEYSYDLIFEHPLYTLFDKLFVNKITGSAIDTITGKARDFIDQIVWCINKTSDNTLGVDAGWTTGKVEDTGLKPITFDSVSCRDMLSLVCQTFNIEFFLNNKEINCVSRVENDKTKLAFEQGRGKGLYEVSQSNVDKDDTVTRIYPVGGNKNVPNASADYNGNLKLPEIYLENFQDFNKIVERKVIFDDIFPEFVGKVDSVSGKNNSEIISNKIDFDLNEIAVGENARINFLTGDLMGVSFQFQYNHSQKKVTLIEQDDEVAFPDSEGVKPQVPSQLKKPKVGDEFNFTGVIMPQSYVNDAINRLRGKATAWLDFHSRKRVKFDITIDFRFMRGKLKLKVGDVVTIKIPEKNIDKIIRVIRFEENINTGAISATVSNYLDEQWEKKIEGQIAQLQSTISGGSSYGGIAYDVIKSGDSTVATDVNLYSARATLMKIAEAAKDTIENISNLLGDALLQYAETISDKFLRKDVHDTAEELLTFLKGIEVFGNAVIETLKVNGNAIFMNVLSSEKFTSGYPGGTGWALFWKEVINAAGQKEKKAVMELDEITVRGVMRVYEFIISQLIGENGTRITSDMMHVHSIDTAAKTIYLDTENGVLYNPFRAGDILMVSQFLPAVGVRQYELRVQTATVGSMTDGEKRLDAITYSNFIGNETDVRYRDVLTRVDSVSNTDRKGIIKTTSVENGAPYMDVLYGMKTNPDIALKTRLGRLYGIVTYLWGQLKGYGLYAENAYITGAFRLLSGEDVRTRFEIAEGKLQSAMQSIVTNLSEKDNFLKNATFKNDMEFWQRERNIQLFDVGGDLIDLNIGFFSEKNQIADIDSFDGRFVLRIKNSFIRQLNKDITKPAADDEIFLTVKYCCREAGHLTAGFAGSKIYTETDIAVSEGEFKQIEVSGLWNGAGDFELRFTGDIYIEILALSTNPLDNYKKEVESKFIQTAEMISAEVTARGIAINGIYSYIDNAGWITTADGNKLWASHTEFNELGNRVTLAESSITQLSNSISLMVSQSDFNALGNRVSAAESSITLLSNGIDLKVNKTDFDALGNRVSTAESKITLNADSISATVTRISNIEGSISSAGWVTKSDGNLLWASKSLENGETIVSKINQTASTITIDAQHIKLEGIVTANSNFKVLLDGSIEANNGKFTGNIQASSGKIGGFTINGGGLTNTPFGTGNEAYIIFRDDPHNVFAGIGTNVLPATSGITAAARFENKDTSGFFASTNIAMYAAASGASRNWGLYSNAPVMADGFIGKKFGSLDFTNSTWSATDFAKSNLLMIYNSGTAKSALLPDKNLLGSILGVTIDNGFAAMYTFFCVLGSVTFTNLTGNNMNDESVPLSAGDVLTVIAYCFGTDFRWLKVSHFY